MSLDIRVVRGDITTIEVDAVVTAGNVSVRAVREADTRVETVLLVAFSGRVARVWEAELHGP